MSNENTSSIGPEAEPAGLGRAIMIGSGIAVVVSVVLITIGVLATGAEWGSAIGLGIFAAFWGGLGFGTMVAGVIWMTGLEKREEAERKAARSGSYSDSTANSTSSTTTPIMSSEPANAG